MKKIYVLIIIAFFYSSCEKENNEKEKFNILYKTIVNDENNELVKVNFYSKTYFPDENESEIFSYGKSKYRSVFDENYLKNYDSLSFIPDMLGYKGCITYMEVSFFFLDSLNILPKTYIISDTIQTDKIISFIWPQDTLSYKSDIE